MKLSKLLAHAASGLETMAEECQARGIGRHHLYDEESRVLDAIAPALVEFVAADRAIDAIEDAEDFETADNMDEHQAANQRLINASIALHDAMKKAGVSCD